MSHPLRLVVLSAAILLLVLSRSTASAAEGELDPTFGSGGEVTTHFAGSDQANAIVIQPDGKVVTAGYTAGSKIALARYNVDGSLDSSFGSGGQVTSSFQVAGYALVLQPDGKLVVAGSNGGMALARYNPNGTIDSSFGSSGLATINFSEGSGRARALLLQTDGKLVAVGFVDNQSRDLFALARCNPDGSLDSTFGNGGKVVTTIGGVYDTAVAAALQADGKIIAAGTVRLGGSDYFGLARYNPDGSSDVTFGMNGQVTTAFGSAALAGLALQPDGRMVAAGSTSIGTSRAFALARYNADGSLDSGFGAGGKVTAEFAEGYAVAGEIALAPEGRIVAAGTFSATNASGFALARFNFDGSLDSSFGNSGRVTSVFNNSSGATANAVALQTNGKIVLAGFVRQASLDYDFALARYGSSGGPTPTPIPTPTPTPTPAPTPTPTPAPTPLSCVSESKLDPAFGNGGKVTTQLATFTSTIFALAVQPDGNVVAVGATVSPRAFALARYKPDGSLDQSFGTGGRVTTDLTPGSRNLADSVTIQPDGKILAVGSTSDGSTNSGGGFALARYNPDGSLDASFGSGGKVVTAITPNNSGLDRARSVLLSRDGKIILVGTVDSTTRPGFPDFGIARYNQDGSLDSSFGQGGIVTTDIPPPSESDFGAHNDAAFAGALQADGKIIAVGYSAIVHYTVARYNLDGSLDASFGHGGIVTSEFASGYNVPRAVVVQPDGKILTAGAAVADKSDFFVVRHNADGSLDQSFGQGGTVVTAVSSGDDFASAMSLQPNGQIIVAGDTKINGNYQMALVRYNPDGSIDPTLGSCPGIITDFGPGDDFAFAVALQSDGKLIAAGGAGARSDPGFGDEVEGNFALARYLISPPPTQLLNISTRLRVRTGDDVLIGGFIVTGTENKKVVVRGLGPSLAAQGVSGVLSNPVLELHGSTGELIASNDDWKDFQQDQIEATKIPPGNDREAALVANLPPAAYTAILNGKDGSTGIGLVEVYDLTAGANSKLANISTRGFVETGDNAMIGGFILGPASTGGSKVIVRALGPSLGFGGALADPTLELHNGNGDKIASNDNWKTSDATGLSQEAEIRATGIPPNNDLEAAIVTTLRPDNYTAIVRGSNDTSGLGLVEVYNLP